MPDELKDLTHYKEIAVDLETYDPNLTVSGSGNVVGDGHIAGVALAVEGWSGYFHNRSSEWWQHGYDISIQLAQRFI